MVRGMAMRNPADATQGRALYNKFSALRRLFIC